ncbi:MAG: hypothetical protein JXA10_19535 [Anaerolineae bacterium]|nr:hypothetical protein [Anaerolineae bacterium]
MGRWRGWIWIGFMLALLIVASGVLNELFVQEQGRLEMEDESASNTYSETYPFPAGDPPQVVIRGGVGDVTIRAGGEDVNITVEYTETAYSTSESGAKNELKDIKVSAEQEGDTLRISTAQNDDNTSLRLNRVDLLITVPDEIALDVYLGTGDIRIEGIRAAGQLRAHTMIGDAALTDVIAPEGMDIQARAGSVTFAGKIGAEGDYELLAGVGTMIVQLPTDTNARLAVQTLFGGITVEGLDVVDTTEQEQGSGSSLRGVLGQNGRPLTITNHMGDIRIAAQ